MFYTSEEEEYKLMKDSSAERTFHVCDGLVYIELDGVMCLSECNNNSTTTNRNSVSPAKKCYTYRTDIEFDEQIDTLLETYGGNTYKITFFPRKKNDGSLIYKTYYHYEYPAILYIGNQLLYIENEDKYVIRSPDRYAHKTHKISFNS